MEKLVFNRVHEFFEKFNCIYENQYGFRTKHSTVHALINITENIRSSLDKNEIIAGIFVDLQKAFDMVSHNILLNKLSHYGIRGQMIEWFRSYLHNRTQIVSVDGEVSDKWTLKHGVPQGAELGPLLFLIYINDLHKSILHSKVYHFADGPNLLHISSSYKKLQNNLNSDLKKLSNWHNANKIALNCTKTELIFFHKPLSDIPSNIKIKLNGKRLLATGHIK